MDWVPAIARWLHIGAGVMWIGLLYYFNFVQVPAMTAAAADKGGPGGAGISKYIAPRGLARHHHAVQRLGADLAEPKEGARPQTRHRRREGQGAQGRLHRLAHQHH